ncbi:MAG: hypothetical protein FD180_3644 [Planctomycetota bacterium]|nr:MAG: hypothetical protein FD180_3644 [Planctomycetota bacterium]
MRNLLLLSVLVVTGCAGSRDPGVVTLSALDQMGRNPGSFNFAIFEEGTNKVAWSGVPAQGATVSGNVKGGEYRLLVISSAGVASMEIDVDGDERVTARLTTGGAARGEARKNGKPFSAEIWMPIPGKGTEKSSALSYITRANADGKFQIDRLPPGKWVLVVGTSTEGFKEVTVKIDEGKVSQIGYVDLP